MIELFVGALIGASTTILALHFTGRKPRRQETYTPDNRVGAVSVDIADRMVRGLIRIIGERWNRCCRA